MKKCLILDTNFLISNNKLLKEFKEKVKDIADIYIPKIVIEEIQGQKNRALEDGYQKIESLLSQNKKYLKYKPEFELEKVKDERANGIKSYLSNYCDNKIIDYNNNMFEIIIDRANKRIPPFINEPGSSDKGFKDTILWCSILEFDKTDQYEQFILITDDKPAFIKKDDFLKNEFKDKHNKEILIFKNDIQVLYELLGLIEKDDVKDIVIEKQETNNLGITDFDTLKNDLNDCINRILYSTFYNEYQDENYTEQNFTIYQKIKNDDFEAFFELLPQYIKEHIFFDFIDITELFSRIGIDCEKENNIPLHSLENLNNIYNQIKNDSQLYNPFITFLINQINKTYQYRKPINDDPFLSINDDFLN